ncbi:hypothetical protein [Streptomyces sp. NPDC048462]|uniref:hypothetical protein n=1 Tax=Streptomyces sp. NPDC048462 TaxID=3365555 RepID=UPI0037134A94
MAQRPVAKIPLSVTRSYGSEPHRDALRCASAGILPVASRKDRPQRLKCLGKVGCACRVDPQMIQLFYSRPLLRG